MIRSLGLVALLVACGKGDEPKPRTETPPPSRSGSAAPAPEPAPGVRLAELPVASGTPFELRDLKVMHPVLVENGKATPESGTLELRVTVKPLGTIGPDDRLTFLTTCRMHDLNLSFDEDRAEHRQNIAEAVDRRGGEISGLFRATPFDDEPQHCELALRHRTGKSNAPGAKATVVATVCLHDKKLTVGPCDPSPFPAPSAPAGVGLVVADKVSTMFKRGNVGITGVFTVVDKLAATEDLGSQWRCSDGSKTSKTSKGGDTYSFWTPRALDAGRSAHGNLVSFVDGDADPTRCQLEVVARPADSKKKPRPLGTYCIDKAGTVTAGACTPKI